MHQLGCRQLVDGLPLIAEVDTDGQRAISWIETHRQSIKTFIDQQGALVLRGLKIQGVVQLSTILKTIFEGELLPYKFRSTPRTALKKNIYTATEYPADQVIPQHNENAYTNSWPLYIGFLCMHPAQSGGETPIANSREVYKSIPKDIRDEFEQKGVMYVRNYNDVDIPLADVFGTKDRKEIEAFCSDNNINCEWIDGEKLRTTQVNPAVRQHPRSGEKLWFNQAHLFHSSCIEKDVLEGLLSCYGEMGLPRQALYGDGSSIDKACLDTIREVYQQHTKKFTWQTHDLMLLDNMLYTHGRKAYTGNRSVVVGMLGEGK